MKKVLIITYYWPPSGGGGVQRWLKFAKYLPEFGWEPIILTPSNPSVLERDDSLLMDVALDLKITKIPIWEPYQIASKFFNLQAIPKQGIVNSKKSNRSFIMTWLRGNLLVPDPRKFWKKSAVKKSIELIENEKIDLVVTTGPPHSMHLIGFELRNKLDIKWVADFRDPWAQWDILDQFKLTKWARKLHEKLEQKVVKGADGIITVSDSWANDFYKNYNKNIKVITNGFEASPQRIIKKSEFKKFRISHFGLINDFRNVPKLWIALGLLCSEDEKFKNDLEIFLAGNIDKNIFDSFINNNLKNNVNYVGYLPYDDLVNEYRATSVFLLLSNNSKNNKGHIPGKLFEYLHFSRPILAFSSINSDAAGIIKSTKSGIIVDNEETSVIKSKIGELYKQYKNGNIILEQIEIKKYERRSLTGELASYFEELI